MSNRIPSGSLDTSPDISASTPADARTIGIEFLLEMAGIGFEVIHQGPGICCHACPEGFDLAA